MLNLSTEELKAVRKLLRQESLNATQLQGVKEEKVCLAVIAHTLHQKHTKQGILAAGIQTALHSAYEDMPPWFAARIQRSLLRFGLSRGFWIAGMEVVVITPTLQMQNELNMRGVVTEEVEAGLRRIRAMARESGEIAGAAARMVQQHGIRTSITVASCILNAFDPIFRETDED